MKHKINAVELFHNSFGLGVSKTMKADLGREKNLLRFNLMDEENKEYFEAASANDLVEVADALGDMLYIYYVEPYWNTVCNIRLKRYLKKSRGVI